MILQTTLELINMRSNKTCMYFLDIFLHKSISTLLYFFLPTTKQGVSYLIANFGVACSNISCIG